MNEAQKLLMDTEHEYENTETESAPSGEWAEYNVHYLQVEARYHGMLEMMNAIGPCRGCEYFKQNSIEPKFCSQLQIPVTEDWYCGDFERGEHAIG